VLSVERVCQNISAESEGLGSTDASAAMQQSIAVLQRSDLAEAYAFRAIAIASIGPTPLMRTFESIAAKIPPSHAKYAFPIHCG
jgi:hypothetical protein